jgi:hypothetical protein
LRNIAIFLPLTPTLSLKGRGRRFNPHLTFLFLLPLYGEVKETKDEVLQLIWLGLNKTGGRLMKSIKRFKSS